MKKNLFYLCVFIFSVTFLNSCDDKGDAKENLIGTWMLNQDYAVFMTWEASESLSIGGIPMSSTVVAAMVSEYGSNVLKEELKTITLKDNDDIEATYKGESGYVTEVYGKYKAISDKKLLYYPDVDKLLKDIDGVSDITMAELKALSKAGIPVSYVLAGQTLESASFYLNTETIKAMKILFPVLASSVSGDSVEGVLVKAILEELPTALDKTTKIELGLNFVKSPVAAN